MSKKIKIYKVGGGIIEEPKDLHIFLEEFAKVEGKKILVHGGGKGANVWLERLGIQPKMVNGRRVTNQETLEVITMVYAGLVNKNIVAKLQAFHVDAIGVSGTDANLILAEKRSPEPIDFGFVGDLVHDGVNANRVELLLNSGLTPAFCALTHDGDGQLLNTNADTIAAELAIALSKSNPVELHYCFDKRGVLKDIHDEFSVIPTITLNDFEGLKNEGVIADGMIPKLDNAFSVIHSGVESVVLEHALYLNDALKTICK